MRIEETIAGARAGVRALRRQGASSIALVPTMGALHAGHLALVEEGRRVADAVAVSIFVNPLQFGPGEDYEKYPRSIEADARALAENGAALLFAPRAGEMYPDAPRTLVTPRPSAALFEGAVRPGHFTGVLTLVAKLFNIMQPDAAMFGRKDLQQLSLIRGMVQDLDFPISVVAVETVREKDGLAMSSRNRYIEADARTRATVLRSGLCSAKHAFDMGERSPERLEAIGRDVIAQIPDASIGYFAVVREADFSTPDAAAAGDSIVGAIRIGGTRLIDNILL